MISSVNKTLICMNNVELIIKTIRLRTEAAFGQTIYSQCDGSQCDFHISRIHVAMRRRRKVANGSQCDFHIKVAFMSQCDVAIMSQLCHLATFI